MTDLFRSVAPTDSLVPAAVLPSGEPGSLGRIVVRFSPFGKWYLINSPYEGRFLERSAPGAFRRTLAERGRGIRIQFDHGHDTRIGTLPLAVPDVFTERADGPVLEGNLFDTSYVRDILPALRAGALGSSFQFAIPKGGDKWVMKPGKSPHNPEGLPERTFLDLTVREAGPVVYPANPAATAGTRDGEPWALITPTNPTPAGMPAPTGMTPQQRRNHLRAQMILRGMH